MNENRLLAQRMSELADRTEVPGDLPGRALRRARRRRSRRFVAASTAVVVVAAGLVAGDVLARRGGAASPVAAGGASIPPSPAHGRPPVTADPGHTLPHKVIVAGNLELAAVGMWSKRQASPTWYLADSPTGEYRRTSYGWVSVAPGAKVAAVLPHDVLSRRIGLLNLASGKTRWIEVPRAVAGLAWSPDGTRLLATAYRVNPDRFNAKKRDLRTGVVIINVKTDAKRFVALPPRNTQNIQNGRADATWSRDGRYLMAPGPAKNGSGPFWFFYTLDGKAHSVPPGESNGWNPDMAGLSPSGRYRTIGAKSRHHPMVASGVQDVRSHKTVSKLPIEQLPAWVNDDYLIGIQAPKGGSEFTNRLVLVSRDGKHITPLTGYDNDNIVGDELDFVRR